MAAPSFDPGELQRHLSGYVAKAAEVESLLARALQVQQANLLSLHSNLDELRGCSESAHGQETDKEEVPFVRSAQPVLGVLHTRPSSELDSCLASAAAAEQCPPMSSSLVLFDPRSSIKPVASSGGGCPETCSTQELPSRHEPPSTNGSAGSASSIPHDDSISSIPDSIATKWLDLTSKLATRKSQVWRSNGAAFRCLRPKWTENLLSCSGRISTDSMRIFCVSAMDDQMDGFGSDTELPAKTCCDRFQWVQVLVADPSSFSRLMWELMGLLFLVYDMITLPLEVFGYEDTDIAHNVRLVACSFWSMDIIGSFFCGYMHHGLSEMRLTKIWKRYLMGWFSIDVFVLATDWVFLVSMSGTSKFALARLIKGSRFVRVVRLLRFMRGARLWQTYENLTRVFLSRAFVTLFHIACLLSLPVIVSHFLACSWYWIGLEMRTTESWLDQVDHAGTGKFEMYWVCFHWAIAQYTPAPDNIFPVTLTERIFAVIVLLVGFIVFTSFLGSVTSMVTAARMQTKQRLLEENQVRRYIHEHFVSFKVRHQVVAITKTQRVANRVPVESEIVLFKSIPEGLLVRLHFEVYSHYMRRHPLFDSLQLLDRGTIIYLCHKAISATTFGRFEDIFMYGSRCGGMMFVTHGSLSYRAGYQVKRKIQPVCRLRSGDFICEPALWLDWYHQGTAVSPKWCNIIVLDVKEFGSIVSKEDQSLIACQNYAKAFIEKICDAYGAEVLFQLCQKDWDDMKIPPFDDLAFERDVVRALTSGSFMSFDLQKKWKWGAPTTTMRAVSGWLASSAS